MIVNRYGQLLTGNDPAALEGPWNQPEELGAAWWDQAIATVTKKVKERKTAIEDRRSRLDQERAARQEAKQAQQAGFGGMGMSPLMIGTIVAAAVIFGPRLMRMVSPSRRSRRNPHRRYRRRRARR